MNRFLAVLASGILLSGCTTVTSPENRVANEPELFEALPEKHRELVRQGRVAEGMSKDAVYLAWGRPQETKESSRNGVTRQAWVYYGTESIPVQTVGIGVGFGDACYGRRYGGGPFYDFGYEFAHRDYVAAKVEFESGRVVYWERNERR
ncbi:MAG: hypothetical protein KDN19_20035 [Verrucomicrobiae bacterium]|nr:hypothetical protein [Verrucomicrobiae bacterium]